MTNAENVSWGADSPQGEGWWMASDGKWYPPESAPSTATGTGPWGYGVAAEGSARPVGGPGQLTFGLDAPLEVDRWRPLVSWLLAIPHLIVLTIYGIGAGVMAVVAFFQVLFTRSVSPGTHTFLVKVGRYGWRVTSYAYFLRNDSPRPYGLAGDDLDPGGDPAWLSLPRPTELNRWAVLYKWILVIPHLIVLWALGIAASFVFLVGFFQVLFTGAWTANMRDFVVKVQRQSTAVYAYLLLTDERPPIIPEG